MSGPEIPKALDAIIDIVLASRPKTKTDAAKKRKKKAKKIAKKLRKAASETSQEH